MAYDAVNEKAKCVVNISDQWKYKGRDSDVKNEIRPKRRIEI